MGEQVTTAVVPRYTRVKDHGTELSRSTTAVVLPPSLPERRKLEFNFVTSTYFASAGWQNGEVRLQVYLTLVFSDFPCTWKPTTQNQQRQQLLREAAGGGSSIDPVSITPLGFCGDPLLPSGEN